MPFEIETNNEEVKIIIIGVGGAGGNAVNRLIQDQVGGVEYIAANTDKQILKASLAENKLQLGEKISRGEGAGSIPEIGRKSAEESYDKIKEELTGAQMVFVAAGMGGGTGTGAAAVVAKAAKEVGALTIGVVNMPFKFEGSTKRRAANEGLEELKKQVDAIIVVSNDTIYEVSPKGTSFDDAMRKGDEILKNGVKGIIDIIKKEGIINTDFADIRTVMGGKGMCHMGFGRAKGENRAIEVAKQAISTPLLGTSIRGATDVLVNIISSKDISMDEFVMIGEYITDTIGESEDFAPNNIKIGSVFSDDMGDEISIVIIATGMDSSDFKEDKVKNVANKVKENTSKNIIRADVDNLDIDNEFSQDNIQNIDTVIKPKSPNIDLDVPDFLKNAIGRK